MAHSVTKCEANRLPNPLRLVGIMSSCGGGDWPPLLALAAGMHQRGHDVKIVCDQNTKSAVLAAGLSAVCLPSRLELAAFLDPALNHLFLRKKLTHLTPNPLKKWADKSTSYTMGALEKGQPTLILGSLLCQELARSIAEKFDVPWCFLNPSFYFGDANNKPLKQDFSLLGSQMYEHWLLPPSRLATAVLHATDPTFDTLQSTLPPHHYFTGPLFWEVPTALPPYLNKPGPPWVLISLSTAPQQGDMEIVQASLAALTNQQVRVLVTLTPQHNHSQLDRLPDNIFITGYIPHSKVLPQCRLAIGHAGHGMVMKSIFYGTPMVLVPWGRDQPGVAARAKAMGVAAVIQRPNFNKTALAEALVHCTTNPKLLHCSNQQSLRLQQTNSLLCACTCLEALFCR